MEYANGGSLSKMM